MANSLQLGIWAKVVFYALVPLVMALMGNRIAAEAISEARRRRRYNVAFLVLLVLGVVGTWLVESQVDRAHNDELATHKAEVKDSKQSIEALRALIESRQRDSDNLIGSLAAKLDPASLARAFAATSSQGIKKEVAAQLSSAESVTALITTTRAFVTDLRRFGSEYSRRIEAIGKRSWSADSKTVTADSAATADGGDVYLTTESGSLITTGAGNPIVVARQSAAQLQLAAAERTEFNAKYLDRASVLRGQLSDRLGGTPDLKSFPSGRLIAFAGNLTAPSAVADAADYLEALVNLLPPTTRGH